MENPSDANQDLPAGFIWTIKILLEDLKNTKSFADVVLISSDNQKFPCHQLILGLSSPVLRSMFLDLIQIESLVVFFPSTHSSILSKVVDILYTGDTKVDSAQNVAIFDMFDHLKITKNFSCISEDNKAHNKLALQAQITLNESTDDHFHTLQIDETVEDKELVSTINDSAPISLEDVQDKNTANVGTLESAPEKDAVRYFCSFEKCGKSFSRNYDLSAHCRLHTGKRPYACQLCESRYTNVTDMRRHMLKMHNYGQKVACKQCGKTFRDSHNLKSHMSVHSGLKPFACDLCPSTFSQKSDLVKHGKIHSSNEPFTCDVCELTFKWKHTLKRHKLTHTGEKRYQCDVCNLKFRQNFDLNKHKRIHTGEKKYSCNFCDKRFSRTDYLSKHLSKWHAHPNEENKNDNEEGLRFTIVEGDGDDMDRKVFSVAEGDEVTLMDCDGETFLVCEGSDACVIQTEAQTSGDNPGIECPL